MLLLVGVLLLLLLLLSTLPACLPVVVCVGGRRAALVHHRARRCEPCEEGRPIGLAACVRAARWPSPPPSAAFVIVCECWLHSWAESPNPRSKAPIDTREPLKKREARLSGPARRQRGKRPEPWLSLGRLPTSHRRSQKRAAGPAREADSRIPALAASGDTPSLES